MVVSVVSALFRWRLLLKGDTALWRRWKRSWSFQILIRARRRGTGVASVARMSREIPTSSKEGHCPSLRGAESAPRTSVA